MRGAVDDASALLRSMGHTVAPRDPGYGLLLRNFMPRYLRGIREDAASMAYPDRLEPRTKGMARLGGLFPPAILERACKSAERDAARVGAIFQDHDVLLTPVLATLPPKVGKWEGRGAIWTFNGVARFVPYTAAWNHVGFPAASVPVGATPDGIPLCVQLIGRPGDEATLLSLAAQMETERPWARRRPAVAAGDSVAAA
jgi:amidase